MAYIGNEPGVGTFIVSTERFNGTGACTQFTITQTGIDDANAIDVIVNSVVQDPTNSYSITDGVITFTEAPSSGTDNIIVRYRATTVITFSSITTSQILDGAITAEKIASGVLPSAAANSAGVYANSAFLKANTPSNVANSAASYANSGFAVANSSASYANSAFLVANNSLGIDTTQNTNITSASSYANSGFAVANSAASYANSAFLVANNSLGIDTTQNTNITSASSYANSSFSKANNALTAASNTATSVQFGSFGVGTAASGTTGEIRATNNITAYYSDDRLKTKLGNIENALDKVKNLTGFYYEANDVAQALGYTVRKEVGLSAQTMQNVMPEIVTTAPIDDKYLTIWYEKTVPLLVEAIKELSNEVEEIKKKLQ
jgi:hypothetical protein